MSIMGAIWKSCGSWFLRLSFLILAPDLSILTTIAGRDAAHAATDPFVIRTTGVREMYGMDTGVARKVSLTIADQAEDLF